MMKEQSDTITIEVNGLSRRLNVITHEGKFHADEVLGIALLAYHFKAGKVCVTRNRAIAKEKVQLVQQTASLIEPDLFIVDAGGFYDGIQCFDHHQLSAACESSLSLIIKSIIREETLRHALLNHFAAVTLQDNGDQAVTSAVKTHQIITINHIISSFYDLHDTRTGFTRALQFAYDYLNRWLNHYNKRQNQLADILHNHTILATSKQPILYHEQTETPGEIWSCLNDINYILSPHQSKANQYVLLARHGYHVKDAGFKTADYLFVHQSGFMGILNSNTFIKPVLN